MITPLGVAVGYTTFRVPIGSPSRANLDTGASLFLLSERQNAILPTFYGHIKKGMLALRRVIHGMQTVHKIQPVIQTRSGSPGGFRRETQGADIAAVDGGIWE
jgi:hypothetical protein